MAEIVLEKQQEPARLRVYIGAAPGVGKTYQMLNDAYMMKHQQDVDVVIGLVEPHGRKETADRIRDLEIIPQRVIPYRGVNLKEMDLDAILARRPHTAIVDELAHTNVPGSKNKKRYEDVLELLDAGINVMTAVNIQHLETLNDAVSRSANTTIRETVPDNFLKRADEVVNIDITVDELRSRLRQGKIYAAEKVEQSLANFFRKGNLNMLRELALRTTAEQVGNRAAEYRRTQGLEQAPIPEKVMVCLSTRPGTERLLRVGSRIAGRLASNWYAVYVARPDEDKGHGDPEAHHRRGHDRECEDAGSQEVDTMTTARWQDRHKREKDEEHDRNPQCDEQRLPAFEGHPGLGCDLSPKRSEVHARALPFRLGRPEADDERPSFAPAGSAAPEVSRRKTSSSRWRPARRSPN